MLQNPILIGNSSESSAHKLIKQSLHSFIPQNTRNVIESAIEKRIENRIADVYFKLKNGNEVVVEVQSSWIRKEELKKRTKDYNNAGYYVLWVLYGNGNILASPKQPKDKENIKISPAENFFHWLYEGRVYYVNIDSYNHNILNFYGLHFSRSKDQPYKAVCENSIYYYIRNAYYIKIPNWNFLCKKQKQYKIARFYDKRPVIHQI